MFNFDSWEEMESLFGTQMISIRAPKGTTVAILKELIELHNEISIWLYGYDKTEILITIPPNGYRGQGLNFSGNQLAAELTEIAKELNLERPIKLSHMRVDPWAMCRRVTWGNRVCG